MATYLVPLSRWFYQGQVAAGAKIYVYRAGSTSLQDVYADPDLQTPTTNPVICDSNGEAVFYVDPGNNPDNKMRLYVTTSGGTLIRDIVVSRSNDYGTLVHGACRLVKTGGSLQLIPFNGDGLIVAEELRSVADCDLLSTSGLSADTTYYIYAYMDGTQMKLAASTNAPSSGYDGNPSTDSTLVGMARGVTGSGVEWVDLPTKRFVRSWYNDPGIACKNSFTTNRSTTSTTFAELNTEIRCEFLAWAGEVFNAACTAVAATNTNGNTVYSALAFDSTTSPEWPVGLSTQTTANVYTPLPIAVPKTGLAVGYHYVTLLGASGSGAASCTWFATSAVGSVPSTAITLSSVRG